jgi:hypothetical protein
MTQKEKVELLKDSIVYLFEKEGRSKSYISRVLQIDRKTLSITMNQWGLVKADKRHFTPSKEKFLNAHKKEIIDMLDSDIPETEIAKKLNISVDSLRKTYIYNNKELLFHVNMYNKRKENQISKPRNSYEKCCDLDGEKWKSILGYEDYEVSNFARVRRWSNSLNRYYLIKPYKNITDKRWYTTIYKNHKSKTYSLPRIVAHAFVDGYSKINNTVDHLDGNVDNNYSDNLEWVSQSINNQRKNNNPNYMNPIPFSKNGKFKYILLNGKYKFKTIRAFAKFLGVSETQAHRYIDKESKFDGKIEFFY